MAISGFRSLDSTMLAAAQLRARFDEATRQAASGQRADSYAGLGADARRSVDLRAEWSRRETLATSAETAGAKLAYTQTVLGRFSEIANGMAEAAGSALGTLGPDRAMVAQNARAALAEVAGLLGERYQGEALFGGSDPTGSPIVSPGEIQQTGLYAGTRAAMARLGQDGAAAVLAETRALAASDAPGITPFSAHASAAARGEIDDPRPGVTLGEGVRIELGLYANRNATGARPGEDSTGSWARDLLHGLSVLANLDAAPAEADVAALLQGTVRTLRAAADGVNGEAGALGNTEQRLAGVAAQNREVAGQLELQVGALESVDPAEAFVRMQAIQTQLQASYKSLAMLGEMSLANFLR
ncbi:flagellin [Teichococcus aestuarii]|uniref:Flagellin n=1 Tax=Teichococcus aestuarii TaxID=568898 RepID=A0A2U1V2W3_9PROT|nr:flagellin [Pseudoroseomonas aestuarii]PWC28259.1 hypothetical protein CR165_13270 [Pseudoroseomonas aestuarii]